ncbi:MAG TPA: class I SAM-dependent methyltransferase [Candidatus Dojkabacteria bacterium]|nr:class I SAM-dependent methyltransferase [Candidatus Dojkabacteria bacterium]
MRNLTVNDIEGMSYTDFISFIKETNRCPGGKDTIRKIVQNSFVDDKSRILDVGSNTGFTTLELAHITRSRIDGIDISDACVKTANDLLKSDTSFVKSRVKFQVGSAYEIPFNDEVFDLVVTGGATSFMDKKQKAVSEYLRVLKSWGFLSVTQLFYVNKPPQKVLDKVSNAIGVKIEPWGEEEWRNVFLNVQSNQKLELYYYESNKLSARSEKDIDEYIGYFINKPHLANLSNEVKEVISKKWKNYIDIFNENHKYLGYFIALFRKTKYPEEPELFIRKP